MHDAGRILVRDPSEGRLSRLPVFVGRGGSGGGATRVRAVLALERGTTAGASDLPTAVGDDLAAEARGAAPRPPATGRRIAPRTRAR